MRKIFFIIYFVLLNAVCVFAQQDAMFSQYMFNTVAVNPAYAGSRDVISATALYRKQWTNIPGSPRTVTFSVDAPLKNEKVGLGLLLVNDKIGVTNTTGVYASYAYRIRLKKGTLAMGLQAGFSQYVADLNSVKLDPDNTYDANFTGVYTNKTLPNFGVGFYYNTDKFYVGLSMPHILNNNLSSQSDGLSNNARQYRQYFIMGGYVFKLTDDVKLKPSTLIKVVGGAPIQFDINTNVWFFDAIAIGASYRTSKTLVAMLEIQATKQFRFGYAYDFTLGNLSSYAGGAHEVMLRYEFGYVKAKILSPRYF